MPVIVRQKLLTRGTNHSPRKVWPLQSLAIKVESRTSGQRLVVVILQCGLKQILGNVHKVSVFEKELEDSRKC